MFKFIRPALKLVAALPVVLAACDRPEGFRLRIVAGDYDRQQAIVTFAMPDGSPGSAWRALAADGTAWPVQVDQDGMGTLVLEHLGAGEEAEFVLGMAGKSPVGSVEVRSAEGRVHLKVAGQEVLQYHAARNPMPRPSIDSLYHRSGYLHPVSTPGGRVVTDDYPPNHIHHHGIWAAWTRTRFQGRTPDFWNMGSGSALVEAVTQPAVWQGAVHGGLRARHRYVDLALDAGVVALEEDFQVRLYHVGNVPYHVFDLMLEQEAATDSALILPTHLYGGVGFRGRREWDGAQNTQFLTSEGLERSDGHATRARWCHIGGLVDGVPVGIAILGHPDNREAPQPMRIHPTEPFFNFAPSQASEFAIEPGAPHVMQYRFIVYDGAPDPELLDRLWNDYAQPPVVLVQAR